MEEMEEFVRISPADWDLPDSLECWKGCTVAQRRAEVVSHSMKARGCEPAFNMLYIKEVVFPVPPTVEIHHLLYLRQRIKERFTLDCFQICIDRKRNEVHMLFDWYDRETQQCVYLYKARRYAFCAVIIQTLDLPFPFTDVLWLRYLLVEEYRQNPAVFDKMDEWVLHQSPSPRSYQVFHSVLKYVKARCQDLVR